MSHVESHVDKKKGPKGEQREPSPIEWMNIHVVDEEAEKAYTENIPTLATHNYDKGKMENIHTTTKKRITRDYRTHWRNQILEELRMNTTKKLAKQNKDHWGNCPEEIRWDYMRDRRTWPKRLKKEYSK